VRFGPAGFPAAGNPSEPGEPLADFMIGTALGHWLSDFNYLLAQSNAERRERVVSARAMSVARMLKRPPSEGQLLFVGTLTDSTAAVGWMPAGRLALPRNAALRPSADHELVVEHVAGGRLAIPLALGEPTHARGKRFFEVLVPDRGQILRAYVQRNGAMIETTPVRLPQRHVQKVLEAAR
jgi:hypothetical protein